MLNMKVSHDPAVSLPGVNPGEMKTRQNKNSYVDFHSSIIPNCQKVKTTKPAMVLRSRVNRRRLMLTNF